MKKFNLEELLFFRNKLIDELEYKITTARKERACITRQNALLVNQALWKLSNGHHYFLDDGDLCTILEFKSSNVGNTVYKIVLDRYNINTGANTIKPIVIKTSDIAFHKIFANPVLKEDMELIVEHFDEMGGPKLNPKKVLSIEELNALQQIFIKASASMARTQFFVGLCKYYDIKEAKLTKVIASSAVGFEWEENDCTFTIDSYYFGDDDFLDGEPLFRIVRKTKDGTMTTKEIPLLIKSSFRGSLLDDFILIKYPDIKLKCGDNFMYGRTNQNK